MSSVIVVPDLMAAAATNLATINSSLTAAQQAAAASTLEVLPAAADEVSAGIAQLFAEHAQEYQGVAGQAAAFHEQFVEHLGAGANSYASAEAANAAAMGPWAEPGDAFGGVINAALDLVLSPFVLLRGAIEQLVYTWIFKPLYNTFVQPLVDALIKAILQAIVGSIGSSPNETEPTMP